MEVLAYIIFGFTAIQFVVALANLLFLQRLPAASGCDALVSILVPARNEENNVPQLIEEVLSQSHQNFELIIFNDQSTDDTAKIVESYCSQDSRIQLINSEELPSGWTGKNFACHTLANNAKGEYLLFLDADVQISGDIIGRTLSAMQKHKLALLSIFPVQKMVSTGERLVVPNMNYILLSLLPLILVRKSKFSSLSAANGQFMLFDAGKYKQYQLHKKVSMQRVEDIQIARMLKYGQEKIACLSSTNQVQCRMYNGYREAINGLSRSVIMFFGNSFVAALLFWLITTLGIASIILNMHAIGVVIYVCFLVSIRLMTSIVSKQNLLLNLLLGYPQKLVLGVIILKAIRAKIKKEFEWKGRKVT